jgi:hypothetical protein
LGALTVTLGGVVSAPKLKRWPKMPNPLPSWPNDSQAPKNALSFGLGNY